MIVALRLAEVSICSTISWWSMRLTTCWTFLTGLAVRSLNLRLLNDSLLECLESPYEALWEAAQVRGTFRGRP